MFEYILDRILIINFIWYVGLGVGFLFVKNWGMVLYWFGAGILNLGVIITNLRGKL